MSLEREVETFRRKLPELLTEEGKFALVHQDEVAGTFDTYKDAITAGYERFGLEPFLVKKIERVETVHFFVRDLRCPTSPPDSPPTAPLSPSSSE